MAKSKKHGLVRRKMRKPAREMADQDYIDELIKKDPDAARWLDKFNREYYLASFTDDPAEDLHPDRKKVYTENNQRNRDVWNKFQRVPGDVQASPPKDDDDE